MTKRPSDQNSLSKQGKQFMEAARELGCKEDPRAFDRALKKIAEAPPPDTVQERKKKTDKPAK